MKNLQMILGLALAACLVLSSGCSKSEKSAPAVAKQKAETPAGGSARECAAHHAPIDLCFICDASLRDKGRLWCAEHQRYEDRCFICHPELQDRNRLWCQEHSLYEDECFLCHPELKRKAAAGAGAASAALMCQEHGVPEAECAICRPELAAGLKPGQGMKVRLPSTNSVGLVGLHTGRVDTGAIVETVDCVADVSFDQNRLAQIAAPVGGILQAVVADLGAHVEEKQTVAKIWSASIAEAVARAVLSHQTLEREKRLREQRVTSEQSLQEAEATHRAACQQLRTLGFREEQIDELGNKPEEQVLLEVRSPFAGEIVERMAVRGALVETGKPLFTVVDRSSVWAMLQVPEAALARIQTGQAVELRVTSLPDQVFHGKLTWIGPGVDERTRMARARAEFANPEGLLKDKMFANARIVTRRAQAAVVVPASAVQFWQGTALVFVKSAEDLVEARAVALGAKTDAGVEVLKGLKPGETIAIDRTFALKSAMLMSRLGAGCADD